MTFFNFKKIIFLLVLCYVPTFVLAAIPVWQIQPDKSSITFVATQNNSPVTGKFKTFTGNIQFDPNQLSASKVNMMVDIGSVSTSYGQIADTLKTPDWFDAKLFPRAVFKASAFTKTGKNSYQAHGTLTLRDKTLPVVLIFTLEDYTKTTARAEGSATLQRTAFGIGKGDWANTEEVKDRVQVNFTIVAVQK